MSAVAVAVAVPPASAVVALDPIFRHVVEERQLPGPLDGLGDLALMEVVSRMQATLCEGEVLYRLTGVEFVLLSPACDEATLRERVMAMASRIAQPILLRDQIFVLGSLAGGVLFPSHGDEAPLLLRRFDVRGE
mgnify:CR=1 FL=1